MAHADSATPDSFHKQIAPPPPTSPKRRPGDWPLWQPRSGHSAVSASSPCGSPPPKARYRPANSSTCAW